jgi:hypothetical protein
MRILLRNWLTKNYFLPQPKNWHNGTTGMVGKEVTPKTISRHNQKTNLCNQKLLPAATKKDTMAQLVW